MNTIKSSVHASWSWSIPNWNELMMNTTTVMLMIIAKDIGMAKICFLTKLSTASFSIVTFVTFIRKMRTAVFESTTSSNANMNEVHKIVLYLLNLISVSIPATSAITDANTKIATVTAGNAEPVPNCDQRLVSLSSVYTKKNEKFHIKMTQPALDLMQQLASGNFTILNVLSNGLPSASMLLAQSGTPKCQSLYQSFQYN